MGTLSILQQHDKYTIYQSNNLNLDFTKQIKRNDDFISQSLKDLSRKTFMTIAPSNSICRTTDRNKNNTLKKGAVLRAGDIIKIGRVPIMVKESSVDIKKFNNNQKLRSEEL